jgi:hypothetical protein
MQITTGQVQQEDVEAFGLPWRDVNWGIWLGDRLAAVFQAEEDGDGCLAVHATVPRRTLHPRLTYAYAYLFASDLLRLGAKELKAEIAIRNRAAIRVARNAGFTEVSRNDEWVTLRRGVEHGKTKADPDALQQHDDVSGVAPF